MVRCLQQGNVTERVKHGGIEGEISRSWGEKERGGPNAATAVRGLGRGPRSEIEKGNGEFVIWPNVFLTSESTASGEGKNVQGKRGRRPEQKK